MADTIKFVRVTVGDKSVCPDCIRLENEPEKTLEEWENSGQAPRVANTQCNGRCRCGLAPSSFQDFQRAGKNRIDKFIKEVKDNVVTDITHGRKINLKDFQFVKNITKQRYSVIAKMETLITEWKIDNDFKALPKEFFDLADVTKMTAWLKRVLKNGS